MERRVDSFLSAQERASGPDVRERLGTPFITAEGLVLLTRFGKTWGPGRADSTVYEEAGAGVRI